MERACSKAGIATELHGNLAAKLYLSLTSLLVRSSDGA
jgi:hypothetical protein